MNKGQLVTYYPPESVKGEKLFTVSARRLVEGQQEMFEVEP